MPSFQTITPRDNPNEGRDKINYNFTLISMSGGGMFSDYLPLSGGTVSGTTNFNNGAVIQSGGTDLYSIFSTVTGLTGNYLPLSGGTVSGTTNFNNGAVIQSGGTDLYSIFSTVTGLTGNYLPLSGGTVNGYTTISGTNANHGFSLEVGEKTVGIYPFTGVSMVYRNITGDSKSVTVFAGGVAEFDYVAGIFSLNSSGGTTSFSVYEEGSSIQFALSGSGVGGGFAVSPDEAKHQYKNELNNNNLSITSGGCEWNYTGSTVMFFPKLSGTSGQSLFTDGFQNLYFSGINETNVISMMNFVDYASTAQTIDVSISRTTKINLVNGLNLNLKLSGFTSGDTGNIMLIQGSAGDSTLTITGATYNNYVVNGGSGTINLTQSANAIDIISYLTDGVDVYWSSGYNYT